MRKTMNKMFVKGKIITIAVMSLWFLTLVSCENSNSQQKDIEKFMECIEAGEYEKADKIHEKKVVGNEENENEIQKYFKGKMEEVFEKFNSGELSYTAALEEIERYAVYVSELYTVQLNIFDELRNSKNAFEKAEAYFAEKDYKSALAAYMQVIEDDSNYKQAQANCDTCYESIVVTAMETAENVIEREDYIEAIYQLREVEDYIRKEDLALYEEKMALYMAGYRTKFADELDDAGKSFYTITYNGIVFEYGRICDIEITNMTKENEKLIVSSNVSLTNGISDAVVQYVTIYVEGKRWFPEEIVQENILSCSIPVYAEAEWRTSQAYDDAFKDELVGVRLYSKTDNSLVKHIDLEDETEYEYEYKDGKLYAEYITEELRDIVNYYNEDGKISLRVTNNVWNEIYTYDDGNLISYVDLNVEDNEIFKSLEYVYENGLLVYECEFYKGESTETKYEYTLDGNGYVTQKIAGTYYTNNIFTNSPGSYHTISYYENDINGNPLAVSEYSIETGDLLNYYKHTYYDDGTMESFTSHVYMTTLPEKVKYYDKQGNVICYYDYSYSTGGNSREKITYCGYGDKGRLVTKERYVGKGYYNEGQREYLELISFDILTEEELIQKMPEWNFDYGLR